VVAAASDLGACVCEDDATVSERDALARVAELEAERDRLVCSWCGEDFQQGDWASTDCCSCDPVPASSLPSLLKDARKEAQEAVDAGFAEDEAFAARVRVQAEQIAALQEAARQYRTEVLPNSGYDDERSAAEELDAALALAEGCAAPADEEEK
jgi:hypothetical protein